MAARLRISAMSQAEFEAIKAEGFVEYDEGSYRLDGAGPADGYWTGITGAADESLQVSANRADIAELESALEGKIDSETYEAMVAVNVTNAELALAASALNDQDFVGMVFDPITRVATVSYNGKPDTEHAWGALPTQEPETDAISLAALAAHAADLLKHLPDPSGLVDGIVLRVLGGAWVTGAPAVIEVPDVHFGATEPDAADVTHKVWVDTSKTKWESYYRADPADAWPADPQGNIFDADEVLQTWFPDGSENEAVAGLWSVVRMKQFIEMSSIELGLEGEADATLTKYRRHAINDGTVLNLATAAIAGSYAMTWNTNTNVKTWYRSDGENFVAECKDAAVEPDEPEEPQTTPLSGEVAEAAADTWYPIGSGLELRLSNEGSANINRPWLRTTDNNNHTVNVRGSYITNAAGQPAGAIDRWENLSDDGTPWAMDNAGSYNLHTDYVQHLEILDHATLDIIVVTYRVLDGDQTAHLQYKIK